MQTAENKIYYTLRMAMAMCFIGHGAFGIITKQIWCNYFGVFGIDSDAAYRLMPPLGLFDIILGIIILMYPVRVVVAWLMVWGLVTALLRPLSGEPFAEFFERAGNYGVPFAMLLLTSSQGKNLLMPVTPNIVHDEKMMKRVRLCLKVIVFLLLAGHGWLNLTGKKLLLDQYASLGFTDTLRIAMTVGVLEIAAACAVLIRPVAWFLLVIFVWKMGSEMLYPHYATLEWIERGGSYGAILALFFATDKNVASLRAGRFHPLLRQLF